MIRDTNLAPNVQETQNFEWEVEINPELKNALDEHILDIEPYAVGNEGKQGSLGDAAVGAAGALVERCGLEVPKLVLHSGENIVMIGKNGAGKSTVYDAIMNLRHADWDIQSGSGAVLYGKSARGREKLRVARLNQEEVLKQIGQMTAREVLEQTANYFKQQLPIDWENADAHEKNLTNQEAHQRIEELTSQAVQLFEMEEFMDRKIDQLSGGERTKIVLLTVLSSEPDLLLLDEPTNHLDMASITKLTSLFEKYKRAGTSVVSVSHVDWFLRQAGQDGIIEVTREGDSREVRQSGSSYTNYMRDRSRPASEIGEKIEWSPQTTKAGAVIPTLEKVTILNSPIRDAKLPSIAYGEMVFFLGDNGTGKTKLLEAMKGSREIPKSKGINIAFMPQFWPREVAEGSVGDFYEWVRSDTNPAGAKKTGAIETGTIRNKFIKALALQFGKSKGEGNTLARRPLSSFSGGEQRMMWMIAASAQEQVDVLLLDEPTNHMDRGLRAKVTQAIRDFPGAVVMATHDVDLIEDLARDSGKPRMPVLPRNLVLTKEMKGAETATKIEVKQGIKDYIQKIREKALKSAGRVKV